MIGVSLQSRKLAAALAAAAILWFFMFSPWTGGLTNFWVTMACAALVLTSIAVWFGTSRPFTMPRIWRPGLQLVIGIGIAAALWGVFWIGDKLSSMMFDFARPGVDAVYSMKDGSSPVLIAILLLFVIGPAEEFFWRGYIQRSLVSLFSGRKFAADIAFAITTAAYTLVHIWSFNFMLIMAALVAGGIWGLLYRFFPRLLPALIVSHALWDALVFVVFPI